jgi:hypothetical protein
MEIDFPSGVREIIESVFYEQKDGKWFGFSDDRNEDALKAVVRRIREKSIRIKKGIPVSNPVEAIKDLDWLAETCIRILLSDLHHR